MNYTKFLMLVAYPVLTTSKIHAQSSIENPLQHFKSECDLDGVPRIYQLDVDVNNDGKKEIFLSTGKSDPPSEDETEWAMYIAKEDGKFILAGEKTNTGVRSNAGVVFKKNQYWIGLISELNRYGLLYLSSGRGGQAKCQLKAIVIEGDTFKEIPIGEPVSAEANYEQLAQRFPSPPTPAISELIP